MLQAFYPVTSVILDTMQAHKQTFLKGGSKLNLAWSHTNEKATQNMNIKLSASKELAKIGGSSEPLEAPLVTGLQ